MQLNFFDISRTFALKSAPPSRRDYGDFFSSISWSWEVAIRAEVEPLRGVVDWHSRGNPQTPEQRARLTRQWSERFHGRRSPGAKLIDQVEEDFAGTAQIVSMPLWPALAVDRPLIPAFSEVKARLRPVRRRVFSALLAKTSTRTLVAAKAYRLPVLDMAHSANLDDLACLLMLLRTSIEQGWDRNARLLAEHVFFVLLVQAPWLADHGILLQVIDHIDIHFFQKVEMPYVSWLSAGHYWAAIRKLLQEMEAQHSADARDVPLEVWKPRVLESPYAWELTHALRRLGPLRPSASRTAQASRSTPGH